ncbi:hypothetical protein [Nocardia paucivorans]|uniref:hypothetical protein n=1 Tax=Nocardia paucivorans TaxID=114259 RepID=UPI0012F915D3|nr:hypothetical protein [Nocardia paucivorans]
MGRRRGVPVAVAAVALFVAVMFGMPQASAEVTRVGVMPDMSFGFDTNYGTGCTYTVQALLTEAVTPVTFYDNGVPFATVPPAGGGVALVTWVPGYTGLHTLSAVQPSGGGDPWVQVLVGEGVPVGYSCLVRVR